MSSDFDGTDRQAGLTRDLQAWDRVLARRQLLEWAALGLGSLACGGSGSDPDAPREGAGSSSESAGDGSCLATPEETPGPFPGDGTNGPNALALGGIVRSDIRSSIAGASGRAAGVPLTLRLQLLDASCAPLPRRALYVWHCDRDGRYSMYSPGAENENYLRGVQETDADGLATFVTTFPGCYPGRWPHVHFDVYSGLAPALAGSAGIATSQLALSESSCSAVFATEGYEASRANLARLTLASDGVFADGVALQLAEMTGSTRAGWVATLRVTVRG